MDNGQRQEEIARMTGGKTLSKVNMEHASELIRMRRNIKASLIENILYK